MIRYIADLHFNHLRILEFCPSSRPYPNIHLMNEALIDGWNSVVTPEDEVRILGDVGMGDRSKLPALLARLNRAKLTLIMGNHDKSKESMLAAGFDEVYDELALEIDGYKVLLIHQPPQSTRKDVAEMDYVLCGHVHQAWKNTGKYVNVGADVQGFQPKQFPELIEGIAPRSQPDWSLIDDYYEDRVARKVPER